MQLSEQNKTELESCTFIKTVLMLSVVIYHCLLFWKGTWFTKNPVFEAESLAWIAVWMDSFHIYGFTLVSGYIFYHVKYRMGRYADYKAFLINKIKRLLIPYVFVAVLWVIPVQCCFAEIDVGNIIKNYVMGCSPGQLWFLLMLFGVFAMMWPISEFVRKHDLAGAGVIGVLCLVGMIGQRMVPNVFRIWTACQYCLFFWIGMKLCQYTDSRSVIAMKRIPAWVWIATDIVLYVVVREMPENGIMMKLLSPGLNVLLKVIGALMAFFVIGKVSAYIPWKTSRLFSGLTKYSFPIYLFHQQLVYCALYFLNGRMNPYMHAMVNILVAIAGSLLISWGLMKFKMTRMMIGEKG